MNDKVTDQDIDILISKILSLSPNYKQLFWTKLWNCMKPYDLYLVQKHLDPKVQNHTRLFDGFSQVNSSTGEEKGIKKALQKAPTCLPTDSFTCTPRFDIIGSLSNWPEGLELIVQHLELSDIIYAQQVSKVWSALFRQEHLYRRLMFSFYPSINSFDETSKGIKLFCKETLCCTNKKWLQLLIQHHFLSKELTFNPHAIQHIRLLPEKLLSRQVSHDPIIFLQRLGHGSLIGLAKKSAGAQIIRFDNTVFLNQEDSSYTLDTPLVGEILSTTTKFDIAYCPSALVTDPNSNWIAFSTYLRHDPGPKIYSLADKQLIFDPRSSINDPTTGAIVSLISFQVESNETCVTCCYLAAGTADGRVFIWWIPSNFTTAKSNHIGPKLLSIISVAGPRVPILGLHFIFPGNLVVVSRLGNIVVFDLFLNNHSNEQAKHTFQIHNIINLELNRSSKFNSVFQPFLNIVALCRFELPHHNSLENDLIHKFSFRGSNIILSSLTTLFHLVVLKSPFTKLVNVSLLYTALLPCQPSSIELSLQPFAGLSPTDLTMKSVPIFTNFSKYSDYPICVYGVWCTNLRPNPGHSLYLMVPNTKLWKGVKGSLYSGQGVFTSSSVMTPDLLALGGRDGCLHLIRFPVSPKRLK